MPRRNSFLREGCIERKIICGTDEVGRGPLAGPVVAAAVILDPDKPIDGLADSKTISPAGRLKIFSEILDNAADFAIAGVSCVVIDKINILQASLLAMKVAIEKLRIRPDLVYIDGNKTIPGLAVKQKAVVGGDRLIPQVSAASILAKVTRDTHMFEMSKIYPEYNFEKHKGYGTKEHIELINEFGPCEIHRKSFSPISQFELLK